LRCDTVVKLATIVISTDILIMAHSISPVVFKSHFWSVAVSLAALMPCMTWAQATAAGSFTASAVVVKPLTITSATALSFGSFVAGKGGTVTIPSVSPYTRTSTSLISGAGTSLNLVASNAGAVSNITISGIEGTTYTVVLPTVPTTLSTGSGGATMSMTDIKSNLVGLAGTIPASGVQTFQIGGTLTVGADQLSGTYSATLPITISYN
jgi:spore coat protein U-like protein